MVAKRARMASLLVLSLAAGCGFEVGFGRRIGDREDALRAEIRSYYEQVAADFAAGNADALTELFDAAIAKPMTREQIRAWARKFFDAHGPARFSVSRLEFDTVGPISAEVTLGYRVETRDGKGSFGGTERDELVRRGGRWSVASWEKL